jgi:hypothetical protein
MDNSQFYLDQFKKYISLQTASPNTIKNYLSDLRVFFNFAANNLNQPLSSQTIPNLLSENTLLRYDEYLSQNNPPTTAKRRTSSLKKFIEYCSTISITPPNIPPSPPPPPPPPPPITYDQSPINYSPAESFHEVSPKPWSLPNITPTSVNSDTTIISDTPPVYSNDRNTQNQVNRETALEPSIFTPPPSLVNFLPDFNSELPSSPHPVQTTHVPKMTPASPIPISHQKIRLQFAVPIIAISFLITFIITYFAITLRF